MDPLVEDARAIFEAAVRSVQADRMLEDGLLEACAWRPVESYRRVIVAGMGKASMAMAGVVERQLAGRLDEGAVVVPEGYADALPDHLEAPERIEVMTGAHPLPDASSVRAARRMLELAAGCGEDDLFVVLVSGGGTALCNDFAEGLALEEVQATYELLEKGGADIYAKNAVRRHLSRIGGGRLAQAAAPAEVLALVVSDVVGDDLSVVASGPTAPDDSTFDDAIAVLKEYALWDRTPESVRRHLAAGRAGDVPETPKPDEAAFGHVHTELIGSNRDALQAAHEEAQRRGYTAEESAAGVTGEAREVGRQMAGELLDAADRPHTCLLWGGETTVTVRGEGTGGRNQELALAAALELAGHSRPLVLLSGGTDGTDGPTPAAGAWATPATAAEARERGLDPQDHLDQNDAYHFFEPLDALVVTGATHTNVVDVQIALVGE